MQGLIKQMVVKCGLEMMGQQDRFEDMSETILGTDIQIVLCLQSENPSFAIDEMTKRIDNLEKEIDKLSASVVYLLFLQMQVGENNAIQKESDTIKLDNQWRVYRVSFIHDLALRHDNQQED